MPGLNYGEDMHMHGELAAVLKGIVDGVNRNLTENYLPHGKGFRGALDAYLGEMPKTFTYKGKEYTPKSFAASLGFNPDDYVNITSIPTTLSIHSLLWRFPITGYGDNTERAYR